MEDVPIMEGSYSFQSKEVSGAQYSLFLFYRLSMNRVNCLVINVAASEICKGNNKAALIKT